MSMPPSPLSSHAMPVAELAHQCQIVNVLYPFQELLTRWMEWRMEFARNTTKAGCELYVRFFCLFHILRNCCTPYLIAGSRRQKISCSGGANETETILDSYHHRALSCWRVTFLTWPSHPRFIILWQQLNMGISDLIFSSARTNHHMYPISDENN